MPKTNQPKVGKSYGVWGTRGIVPPVNLLDGTVFRTEAIDIATYRKMRNDYQIAACLNVIAFTIQKIDWFLEGGRPEVRDKMETAMKQIWNRLIKSVAKGFWAGFSPNTLVFDYDEQLKIIVVKQIRDLAPETCRVQVDLKTGDYLGFKQFAGSTFEVDIPAKYTFWYAHQMEDGDLYGRSMLRAAYNPWYFGELIHLFANRYYERFGEPTVKGMAPNSTVKDSEGNVKFAMDIMQSTVEAIKSHTSLTIPSDRDETGNLQYDIQYLESQMRGVDFNTYLNRLDMEKARAIFIPDLLLGTGRVGSYELGKEHKATFLTGLMGIMDDISEYIQHYLLEQLVEINWGTKEEVPQFTYLPLSQVNQDLLVNVVGQVLKHDPAMLDIHRLANKLGIPLTDAEFIDVQKEISTPPPVDTTDIQKQPIIKKQVDRVSHHVENIYRSLDKPEEKLAALEGTKIGYGEHFDPHRYTAREKAVREYLVDAFQTNASLDQTLSGLPPLLGICDKEDFVVDKISALKAELDKVAEA